MRIRGERECKDCGTRWSYYETGTPSCPDCGSLRSVGVGERTQHTAGTAALDLSPARNYLDDGEGGLRAAAERAAAEARAAEEAREQAATRSQEREEAPAEEAAPAPEPAPPPCHRIFTLSCSREESTR